VEYRSVAAKVTGSNPVNLAFFEFFMSKIDFKELKRGFFVHVEYFFYLTNIKQKFRALFLKKRGDKYNQTVLIRSDFRNLKVFYNIPYNSSNIVAFKKLDH